MANPGKILRAIGVGTSSIDVFPPPIKASRAPTTSDNDYPIGQKWIYSSNEYTFMGGGTWDLGGAGAASTTEAGVIEIATDAEAVAKSETDLAIVPSNLAASGFLQYSDVTITAAQVKALATTPITLVAAPAAGLAHLFMGAMFKLNYGSEVFAEAGDNLGIKYTDASGVQVSDTVEMTGFIDQSADTITNAVPVKDAIVVATGAEAQALVLDNLNANITGNASNDSTLTVRVYYVTQAL